MWGRRCPVSAEGEGSAVSGTASAGSTGARSPGQGPQGHGCRGPHVGGWGELAQGTPSRHPAPDIHAPCLVLSSAPLPPPPASLDLVGRLLGNRLPLCRVFPRPGHRALRHHRWPGVAPAAAASQAQRRAGRGEHAAMLRPPPRTALLPGPPCHPCCPPGSAHPLGPGGHPLTFTPLPSPAHPSPLMALV